MVGIQTSAMCRNAGMPTIASTTQRSAPSNWRRRRIFRAAGETPPSSGGGLGVETGGFWTWTAVATAAPASPRERSAPAAAAAGASGVTLLGEDRLGLSLHVFEDPVDAGRGRR